MSDESGYATVDERWAAVVGRDRRAAGAFLYAVRTTGVYCRPSCASRLPRRENVAFFDACELAERQGYRACRRCRPRAGDPTPAAIARARQLIDGTADPPPLKQLAAAVGLSLSHFHRLFKRTVGMTPREYAASRGTRVG